MSGYTIRGGVTVVLQLLFGKKSDSLMSSCSFDSLAFIKAGPQEAVWVVSVCARPLIRLHAAQTCAVLKLERFEDNRSADGDVRQAADRVAS